MLGKLMATFTDGQTSMPWGCSPYGAPADYFGAKLLKERRCVVARSLGSRVFTYLRVSSCKSVRRVRLMWRVPRNRSCGAPDKHPGRHGTSAKIH